MSNIQVTLTFPDVLSAVTALARLDGVPTAPKGAGTAASAASTPPATPGKSEAPATVASDIPATSPAPKPSPSPKAPPAPAAKAAEPVVTYPTSGVPELIQQLQKAGRVPDIKATLAEFGVAKGPELKAEQLAPFKAALEKLLAPEAEENLS